MRCLKLVVVRTVTEKIVHRKYIYFDHHWLMLLIHRPFPDRLTFLAPGSSLGDSTTLSLVTGWADVPVCPLLNLRQQPIYRITARLTSSAENIAITNMQSSNTASQPFYPKALFLQLTLANQLAKLANGTHTASRCNIRLASQLAHMIKREKNMSTRLSPDKRTCPKRVCKKTIQYLKGVCGKPVKLAYNVK